MYILDSCPSIYRLMVCLRHFPLCLCLFAGPLDGRSVSGRRRATVRVEKNHMLLIILCQDEWGADFVPTMREALKCWNMTVQHWLVMVVYKRWHLSSGSFTNKVTSLVVLVVYKRWRLSSWLRTKKVTSLAMLVHKRWPLLSWSYTKGEVFCHGLIQKVTSLVMVL